MTTRRPAPEPLTPEQVQERFEYATSMVTAAGALLLLEDQKWRKPVIVEFVYQGDKPHIPGTRGPAWIAASRVVDAAVRKYSEFDHVKGHMCDLLAWAEQKLLDDGYNTTWRIDRG